MFVDCRICPGLAWLMALPWMVFPRGEISLNFISGSGEPGNIHRDKVTVAYPLLIHTVCGTSLAFQSLIGSLSRSVEGNLRNLVMAVLIYLSLA